MPLPIPKQEENKSQFISRCMEDITTKGEFTDVAQRIAVCNSLWDKKDNIENAVKVRKNKDCPDGWEHLMDNGKYMCGKTHPKKQTY